MPKSLRSLILIATMLVVDLNNQNNNHHRHGSVSSKSIDSDDVTPLKIGSSSSSFPQAQTTTSFTIAHVNDLHSHFEEVSVNTGRCKKVDSDGGKCYGGIPRMITKIKELREEAMVEYDNDPNAFMLLNAGDFYQGTIWYTKFKYEPVVEFGNMMNYTAFGLGNHDFDDGAKGLLPLTKEANYDILAANIGDDPTYVDENHPELEPTVSKSKVIEMSDGSKVGIIGYVTKDTHTISTPGKSVKFFNVIESVKMEAERLESEGVKIIIALGHNGYDQDIEMAKQIPQLDLVVGGHSHTFLYDSDKQPLPSIETPEGPYPTYVEQVNTSKVVPVVQAYCYTKYMGKLKVNFDESGDLMRPVRGVGIQEADVILLNASIGKDREAERQMDKYRTRLEEYYEKIGETEVDLLVRRQKESLMGDVVTDSMYEAYKNEGVTFAILNNGGIRSVINSGAITGVDIFNVLPFQNELVILKMTGAEIKSQLELVAANLCPNEKCFAPTFLQMSHNVKVKMDIKSYNKGHRVTSIKTTNCDEVNKESIVKERWCDVLGDKVYKVVTNDFLANQMNHTLELFKFPRETPNTDQLAQVLDYDAMKQYVERNSPLRPKFEDRIVINYYPDKPNSSVSSWTYLTSVHKIAALFLTLFYAGL